MNKKVILIILGAIILCFAGFNGKYPLLTAQSSDYIQSGYTKHLPESGTLSYGLFIVQSSWKYSLWLTILTQSLVLSLMVFYLFKYFAKNNQVIVNYLICIFSISFLTSASVIASSIHPAIFGCISYIGIYILLFAEKIIKRDLYIIIISVIFSLMMNLANILTTSFIILIYLLFLLIRKLPVYISIRPELKRLALVAVCLVSGFLFSLSLNYVLNSQRPTIKTITKNDMPKILSGSLMNMTHITIDDDYEKVLSLKTTNAIHEKYFHEVRELYLSKRFWNGKGYKYLNYCNTIIFIICLLFYLNALFRKKDRFNSLFLFSILVYILFAFSNAILHGNSIGSQHHLTWLMLLPILLNLSKLDVMTKFKDNTIEI